MIFVNLLPEEFKPKSNKLPIPLREILLFLSVGALLLSAFFFFLAGGVKRDVASLKLEYDAIYPDLSNAEKLMTEMNSQIHPRKSFIEELERPERQWDIILNRISDALPSGIWLTHLKMTGGRQFEFVLEGFAKPSDQHSPVEAIGKFSNQLKRALELDLSRGVKEKTARLKIETFTEQQTVEAEILTGFTLKFSKEVEHV